MKHPYPYYFAAFPGQTTKWLWQLAFILSLLVIPGLTLAQTYTMVANGTTTFTTCSGFLYDDGGPNAPSTLNSINIVTLMPATAGSKIRLQFTEFDVDLGYDLLTIYDGPSTASPVMGEYSMQSPGLVYASNSIGSLTLRLRTDSNSLSNGFTAAIACVTTVPPSDLTIPLAQVHPGTVVAGETVATRFTITNLSGITAASSNVSYYLSLDAALSANDVLLDTIIAGALAVDSSASQDINTTIPSGTMPGTYYVLFVADPQNLIPETNEQNNVRAVPLSVVPPNPDLILTTVYATPNPTAAGGTIVASSYGENQGSTIAFTFNMGYYLSTDSVLSANDALLGVSNGGVIAAGAGTSRYTTLTIPPATAIGTYYVLFVADYLNEVTESNEQNNVKAAGISVGVPSIDLLFQAAFVNPSSVAAGSSATASSYLYNAGNAAVGTISVGYYLSSDAVLSANDIVLGSTAVAGLNAGQLKAVAASCPIPATTVSGNYFLLFVADPANLVMENDETNNLLSQVLTVATSTATQEQLDGLTLNVYPNPAVDGQLEVRLDGPNSGQKVTLALYNALGQPVAQQTLPSQTGHTSARFSTRALPAGVYLLRITGEKLSVTRRIVVE